MKNYNVLITQEGKFFVAKNVDLGVVSQGESIEISLENLREATELFLEDYDAFSDTHQQKTFLTTMSV